jgi:hypothetical protein
MLDADATDRCDRPSAADRSEGELAAAGVEEGEEEGDEERVEDERVGKEREEEGEEAEAEGWGRPVAAPEGVSVGTLAQSPMGSLPSCST